MKKIRTYNAGLGSKGTILEGGVDSDRFSLAVAPGLLVDLENLSFEVDPLFCLSWIPFDDVDVLTAGNC